MGGDNAPETTVAGALRAARELPCEIVLIGDQDAIAQQLNRYRTRPSNLSILHAPEVIGMDESPVASVRKKRRSSINVGMEDLREGRVDAFVSAGNTGAVVSAGTLLLGLLPGAERPGIAILLPGIRQETLLIDVGANIAPKPAHLLQYALMGEAYMRFVLERERPRVGLLNVGEEETKGTEFIRETYEMLERAGVNFTGNAEGRDIFLGTFDVIVCDGFVGNVALKTSEGLARMMGDFLKEEYTRGPLRRLAALVSLPVIKAFRRRLDHRRYNGATLLGLRGIVVKSHGSADRLAFATALARADAEVSHGLNERIAAEIARLHGLGVLAGSTRPSGPTEVSA